jgi:hypothetical protein
MKVFCSIHGDKLFNISVLVNSKFFGLGLEFSRESDGQEFFVGLRVEKASLG